MPRFSPEQIYAFAREAGFTPDQSATMTAIALAESGGNSRSHATVGEDSRGLWQINASTHANLAGKFDLYDPVQNARAAFEVSHHGADVSPWTVTHGGLAARYLRYKEQAQAAAAAYGDGHGLGVWQGTPGYGHPLPAGDAHGQAAVTPNTALTGTTDPPTGPVGGHSSIDGSAAVVTGATETADHPAGPSRAGEDFGIALDDPEPRHGAEFGIPLDPSAAADTTGPSVTADVPGPAAPAPTGTDDKLHTFLTAALAQTGDQYVFGAPVQPDNADPQQFDCSGLVQWSAHRAGVDLEREALAQYRQMHRAGTVIPVEQALHTPGALLFSFSSDPDHTAPNHRHVAISLGDGHTIEAKGSAYGVGTFNASAKRFHYAALIPGISDHAGPATELHDAGIVLAPPAPAPAPHSPPAEPHPPIEPHPPAGHTDTFSALLDTDPDALDSPHAAGPSAAHASLEPLLAAGPEAEPVEAHELMAAPDLPAADGGPDDHPALGDVDDNGFDDSLEALHWYGGGGLGIGFTADADGPDGHDSSH
jgi:cell wall-associated NlpC family hydrolase